MNTITAIPTEYKGYRFRSGLEERQARFEHGERPRIGGDSYHA